MQDNSKKDTEDSGQSPEIDVESEASKDDLEVAQKVYIQSLSKVNEEFAKLDAALRAEYRQLVKWVKILLVVTAGIGLLVFFLLLMG